MSRSRLTTLVLKRCCADGVAVLFSSHQLELVERLCDRVTIIRSGHVIASGTLEQLRAARGEDFCLVTPGIRLAGDDAAIPQVLVGVVEVVEENVLSDVGGRGGHHFTDGAHDASKEFPRC